MRERVREERESRCAVQRVDRQSMIEQGKKEKKKHGAWSILNERGWVRETRLVESRTERRPRVRRRENRARTLVDALRWVDGEGHSIEGERAGEGKAASRKIVQQQAAHHKRHSPSRKPEGYISRPEVKKVVQRCGRGVCACGEIASRREVR